MKELKFLCKFKKKNFFFGGGGGGGGGVGFGGVRMYVNEELKLCENSNKKKNWGGGGGVGGEGVRVDVN